jgi:hypothetical protein
MFLITAFVAVAGVHEFGAWRGALLTAVVFLLMPYQQPRKP